MEGWKYYEGKKVYIVLKNRRQYSGKIIQIDNSTKPLIFITLIDKFNKRISFLSSEVELIQEEADNAI